MKELYHDGKEFDPKHYFRYADFNHDGVITCQEHK